MHLLDVASLLAELPPGSATARAFDPSWEWGSLNTQVAVALANEVKLLRRDVIALTGGKLRVDLIRPPSETVQDGDVERSQIGANDGFDTFAEADAWYLAHFPNARI